MSKEKIAIIGFLFMSLSYSQVDEIGCYPYETEEECKDRIEHWRTPPCPPSKDKDLPCDCPEGWTLVFDPSSSMENNGGREWYTDQFNPLQKRRFTPEGYWCSPPQAFWDLYYPNLRPHYDYYYATGTFELPCKEGYKEQMGECQPYDIMDEDRDGVPDAVDNCPENANADQADFNQDGIGDACDESIRTGTISGYVSYYKNATELDLALPNARIILITNDNINPITEAQTNNMGQFTLRGIPIDQDGLRIQIIQNEILPPANLRGNLMWRKFYEFPMGSSYQFRAPDFSRENNFLIYPPGKVIGKIKLGDKLDDQSAHGGITVRSNSALIDGTSDSKTTLTNYDGRFELDKLTQISSLLIQCCWRENEYGRNTYYVRYNEKEIEDLNVIGLSTNDIGTIILDRIVKRWETLSQESTDRFLENDFDEGQNLLIKAIDEIKSDDGSFAIDLAVLTNNLGVTYLVQGDQEKARYYFKEAINISQKSGKNIKLINTNLSSTNEKGKNSKKSDKSTEIDIYLLNNVNGNNNKITKDRYSRILTTIPPFRINYSEID